MDDRSGKSDSRQDGPVLGPIALEAADYRRIKNVLQSIQRFDSRCLVNVGQWSTFLRLNGSIADAITIEKIEDQRARIKTLVDNCRTILSQYEHRLKRASLAPSDVAVTVEKKLRIEALQYNLVHLYDCLNSPADTVPANFQRFLMLEILTDIESLACQFDDALYRIREKRKHRAENPAAWSAQDDAEYNALQRQSGLVSSDLLKRQLAFCIGLAIQDQLIDRYGASRVASGSFAKPRRLTTDPLGSQRKKT